MSPVHVAVLGDPTVYVPVSSEPFWIGRDPGCALCVWDLRVSRRHARITRAHGEFVLTSEGRNGVFVKGARVPVLTLRDGDEIALCPPDADAPVRLRFENTLQDVYVPAERPVSSAWLAQERARSRHRERGVLGHFVATEPVPHETPTGALVRARENESGREAFVQVLPPVTADGDADAFLRLVAALCGAHHPSLARVLEGGLFPYEGGIGRWLATDAVDGRPASERIPEGPQTPLTVVRRLRGLVGALQLLHGRGVSHGGVAPTNVLLRTDGGATLVDYARSRLQDDARPPPAPPRPEPAYVAPEALAPDRIPTRAGDVYGLAAVGFGMLSGRAPFADVGEDRPAPPTLASVGVRASSGLEDVLRRAMSADPAARPDADDFSRALAFAEVTLAGRPA
jgi:serine/threonine-protein kinase